MIEQEGPWRVRFETAEDRGRQARWNQKTREFSAMLVSFTMANGLWDNGKNDPLRPVFALFAMSRASETPFVSNLRAGRTLRVDGIGAARDNGQPMEFLKSAEYEYRPQRHGGGVLVEVFLRELYEFVPGMTTDGDVTFVICEAAERYEREAARFDAHGLHVVLERFHKRQDESTERFEKRIGPSPIGRERNFERVKVDPGIVLAEGRRFAAAIDKRADIPLLSEPLFGVQILCSAMAYGFAFRSMHRPPFSPSDAKAFCEVGMARAKRAPGLGFTASQTTIEEWLAAEVAIFDKLRLPRRR